MSRKMTSDPSLASAAISHGQSAADYSGDPLADETIASILGPWTPISIEAGAEEIIATNARHWQRIAQINRVLSTWTDNAALDQWPERVMPASNGTATEIDDDVITALKAYVAAAKVLPGWADTKKIARAETLFMGYGTLSVTILFCASLPECYVVPDLASVLHATGQLEQHADYRVRATGAMIFPVMMPGGLTDASGGGIAQTLKVRLIHATIRNLILRRSPQEALVALARENGLDDAGVVEPYAALTQQSQNMHHALFALGWKLKQKGLPCNQEELAYTLFTFGYVYLRSMRCLGLALKAEDEEAFLHAWNVMGHVLGIERSLMADTMREAEEKFAEIQIRGRCNPVQPDPRPALGSALMNAMEQLIPFRLLKGIPVLMTQHLCGPGASRDIGVDERVGWLSRILFTVFVGVTRAIDTVVRWVLPEFSLARLFTRMLGDQLMYKLLMDQSRPLKLPAHLQNRMQSMTNYWRDGTPLPTSQNENPRGSESGMH
jgi:ER-bound oxygenase mpaB/B'/Rubber oxygenase, catalytic domain